MEINALTQSAIPKLLSVENAINESVFVQIFASKYKKGSEYNACQISDGVYKFKGAYPQKIKEFVPQKDDYSIIKIKQHSCIQIAGVKKGIQIQDFQIYAKSKEIIGDPIFYSLMQRVDPLANATNKIDLQKIDVVKKYSKPIQIVNQDKKQKEPIFLYLQSQSQDVNQNQLREYQKISDLYVDIQNWTLVCRITDKGYREFTSKKSNKLTKILTLELMDRSGMKIQGTLFGDSGKQIGQKLMLGCLYKISRGQIRQDSYSTNKGSKYSPYSILLTRNSIFVPVKENNFVPKTDEDMFFTIDEVLQDKNLQRQYDVVGIITQIGEQKSLTDRYGKSMNKRSISLSDPQSIKTIQVTLWRDFKIEQSFKGRTVLLKNFKLNSYLNNLSLNSVFKSQIKILQHHRFCKYEKLIKPQTFNMVSQPQVVDNSNDLKYIKRLAAQIQFMDYGSTLYSSLNIWVSHISFKGKWFYQSCPHCKKGGAQRHTTCMHCSQQIQQPLPRFILPVQLSDFTGSVWTTAFDQFANFLLKGKTIQQLKGMEEPRLREQGQRRIFQEFKLRMLTKKQENGTIKHTILGKVTEANPQKLAAQNVLRIHLYE